MTEPTPTLCWAEIVSAVHNGGISPADRQRLLDHVAGCAQCRRALAAAVGGVVAGGVGGEGLDPIRSANLRARLLDRAANDRKIEALSGRSGFNLPAGSGWLVAAGLATLLLSHHAFHRPLMLGWVLSAFLGFICFGLGVNAFVQRRELDRLRKELRQSSAAEKRFSSTDSR